MYERHRLFAKYGHICEMTFEINELPMFSNGGSFFERIKNKFQRSLMASETSRRTMSILKSQAAISKEHHKHMDHLYMIHPFSRFRIIWEIIMIIVYILQFASIPYDLIRYNLKFLPDFQWRISWKILRSILDLLSIANICINFLTGYYDESENNVVMNPWGVAKQYLKTYFIIDLLSSFPSHYDIILYVKDVHYARTKYNLFKLLSLCVKQIIFLRLKTFVDYLHNAAQNFGLSFLKYRLITTTIYFILYFHLITCIVLLAMSFLFATGSKAVYANVDNKKVFLIKGFISTLYQTTVIVTTSHYGVLVQDSVMECVVMFIWFSSKILYIFLLARIMEMIMIKTSSGHKYVNMVRQLQEYMRHKQLPSYMQRRLLSCYEFRFQKSYFRENEILGNISQQLRQEIAMHSCRKLVENVAFFKNLPMPLLMRIVASLKLEMFLVNDVIVKVSTLGDCMYFILTGTVAVYTKSGLEICHLEDGSHFGEVALIQKNRLRIASVVAVEMCELYRLDRADFVHTIYPYPDLLHHIEYIATDRMERTEILDEHKRRETLLM